jgi:hypothetical protein
MTWGAQTRVQLTFLNVIEPFARPQPPSRPILTNTTGKLSSETPCVRSIF